jgi:hypothetical protein
MRKSRAATTKPAPTGREDNAPARAPAPAKTARRSSSSALVAAILATLLSVETEELEAWEELVDDVLTTLPRWARAVVVVCVVAFRRAVSWYKSRAPDGVQAGATDSTTTRPSVVPDKMVG